MPNTADIEHLLRRTEFVARPNRVAELSRKSSIESCVDDVMAVAASPPGFAIDATDNWVRGEQLAYEWFNKMAHDSARSFQEKMAFFWHGHFTSSLWKVELADPMREQIDTFRTDSLGNFRALAKRISIQPAMLRYLDNSQNWKSSPNQNFARELMELFVLGVGNYREADVEAAAAAWTGHTDTVTGSYVWSADHHDASVKQFHGVAINTIADQRLHGPETIDIMLGSGVVQTGAARNVGRPTRDIAAEFISRKLWTFFAGTPIPDSVLSTLAATARATDFDVRSWVRTLLVHPEFYSAGVKQGLVRSPTDLMVAFLYSTGLRAENVVPLWWLEGMGQRLLVPPDVSGWRHNDVFTNASSMANRSLAARYFSWTCMLGFWSGDGLLHLGGGTISRAETEAMADQPDRFVDRLLELMMVSPSAESRDVLYRHARQQHWSERPDLIALALLMPEFHLA